MPDRVVATDARHRARHVLLDVTARSRSVGDDPSALPDGADAHGGVLRLEQIGPGARERVGNKAWNLARLSRANLPVPAGFVITRDAIPVDCESVDRLPASLVADIRRAYRRLGASPVAVRSSASDEDLAGHSAAGLYRSILNVRGEAALLAAVFGCWQAREAPRARLGRSSSEPAGMAVLVQAQVDAEAAGVLFTADPLADPGNDRLLINAVWGLAEPLAAGRTGGDVFRADAAGRLIQQVVGCKERMLTAAGEQPVPPGRRRRPALTAPQIRQLAGLARQVRPHFASVPHEAVDIEFAISDGQPVLLQARPVGPSAPGAAPDAAALEGYLDGERRRLAAHCSALRAAGRLRGDDVVFSAGNIRELLPTPTTFSFGLFRHIFAGRGGAIAAGRRRLGYRLGPDAAEDLFVLIGGQPYFNLEIDAATYDAGVPIPPADLLAAVRADPQSASYPELALYPSLLAEVPGGAEAAAAFHARMLALAGRYQRRLGRLLPKLEERRRRLNRATVGDWPDAGTALANERGTGAARGRRAGGGGLARQRVALGATLAGLRQLGRCFVLAARLGFYFAERVSRRLQGSEMPAPRAARCYANLLQGLPGSRITEQAWELERLARGETTVAAYLANYGHMARNELELSLPRLAERPGEVECLLAEFRASGRQPQREFARHGVRRRRTEAVLRRAMATADRDAFFADLTAAQTFLPLRETIKYYLAAEYARLRPQVRALGRALGLAEGDVFHLSPEELMTLPDAGLAERCAARRRSRTLARELARRRPLPAVIFASRFELTGPDAPRPHDATGNAARDGAWPAAAAPVPATSGPVFTATPIAPGVAEGCVRIIRLDEDELDGWLPADLPALHGAEILVAPSANLGLAPLFRAAAGVVVETGGVLAHSACQAREAGIPALVLADATQRLRDGDYIRIDAGRGEVTLIARSIGQREGMR